MKYKSPMTSEITVTSRQEAYTVIMHFCDYCKKGGIEQYHCSGRDSAMCDAIQEQIAADWSNHLP